MKPGNQKPKKPFVKGDPRINRKGAPKVPKDLKEAKGKLSNAILEAKITKFLTFDKTELQDVIKDPKSQMIDITLCSIIAKAATGADQQRLDWVITRLLGRVKETKEIILPKPTMIERMDGSHMLLAAEILDDE